MIELCLTALIGVSIYLTLDLAGDQIAGAFRDALTALQGSF